MVNIVARDGRLGEVVKQIIGEHLHGQHGQKRQQIARAKHAEHAAEVRTSAHLDIFYDVSEYLASFDDALLEN